MKKIICIGTVIILTLSITSYRCNSKLEDLENKVMQLEQDNETMKLKALSYIAEEYDILYFTSSRTVGENLRYKRLVKEIAEIEPELVEGYDENNNPILSIKGTLRAYVSIQERELGIED